MYILIYIYTIQNLLTMDLTRYDRPCLLGTKEVLIGSTLLKMDLQN